MASDCHIIENAFKQAMHHSNRKDYGRTFAHLMVIVKLDGEMRQCLQSFVENSLNQFAEKLKREGKMEEIYECYEQAMQIYPESCNLLCDLAIILHETNTHLYTALGLLKKCRSYTSSFLEIEELIDDITNRLVERWHFRMLNDKTRNTSYRDAILQTVSPGDSVLDIGCGSGLLSLFANEKSPARIAAIEASEAMVDIAKAVFKKNDIKHVKLLHFDSKDLDDSAIEGRATVALMEIFDAGFFGEGVLETLIHARKELLTPDAKIVPASAKIFACGIRSDRLASKHRCVTDNLHLNEFNIYRATDEPYDSELLTKFPDVSYVTDVQEILKVDFYNGKQLANLLSGKTKIEFTLQSVSDTQIDALAVWFELELSPGVTITTDPRSPNRCNWDQAIFYFNVPLTTTKDLLRQFKMSCKDGKLFLLNQKDTKSHPVKEEIVSILNDSVFFKATIATVEAAFVQLHPENKIAVLDISPFPIMGLQLLMRGAAKLHHPVSTTKSLIDQIALRNGIGSGKICHCENYLECCTKNKFNVIISHPFRWQSLNLEFDDLKLGQALHGNLAEGGLFMPNKIVVKCRLVYSSELQLVNEIDDENTLGYKISDFFKSYQVTRNPISDIDAFNFEPVSEDFVALELDPTSFESESSEKSICLDNLRPGPVNAILSWFEVQYLKDGESVPISFVSPSTDISGHSDFTIHLLDRVHQLTGKSSEAKIKVNIVCVKKMYVKVNLEFDREEQ